MKGRTAAVVLLTLGSALFVGTTVLPGARAATLYVGGSGPGNYTTIQEAVNDTVPGDTIYVFSGEYAEHIGIYKRLSLVGEDKSNTTIIDSGEEGVLHVYADWVRISGFTLRSGGRRGSGVFVNSSRNCTIENLSVSNMSVGLQLKFSSHNTIVNNDFSRNYDGIILSNSNDNIIASNDISDNDQWGITLSHSNDNIIDSNTAANKVLDNGHPPRYLIGILLESSANNIIRSNTISKNAFYGIGLDHSNGNTVADNTIYSNGNDDIHLHTSSNNVIVNNTVASSGAHNIVLSYSSNNTLRANNVSSHSYLGVHLSVSNNNTITENTLRSWRGITLVYSHYNKIFHNNMRNGFLQACDNSELNQWDDGYPSGGNYWDDYDGVDYMRGPNQDQEGSDGIGDTPRIIPPCSKGIDPEDRYPLMEPFVPLAVGPLLPTDIESMHVRNHYDVIVDIAVGEGSESNEANTTVPTSAMLPLDLVRAPIVENGTVRWASPRG